MVIQRSWKILSDTGSTSASSTEANRSPSGLQSSSDDSNCSNQTTHSMVTSVASPPAMKLETSSTTASNVTAPASETKKYVTTPHMAELMLQRLKQRLNCPVQVTGTGSTGESAMRSMELLRISVQQTFDAEIDAIMKRFMENYFKPAFQNIKENLGQSVVSEDLLQKMSCALLENAKTQYNAFRMKPQLTCLTNISSGPHPPAIVESSGLRFAIRRPAPKSISDLTEMPNKKLLTTVNPQNQFTAIGSNNTMKSYTPALLQQQQQQQTQSVQQPQQQTLAQLQQQKSANVTTPARRQIFWNTAHISTTTKFVLDVQANQAFGFGTDGKERLASKHPELIRYLPDNEDRDWLTTQNIIASQSRSSRFLFLIYDEVCRLQQTHEVYRTKANIDMSMMHTFTVPDFMIQKMKLFFVDLNIKSRGLITNSFSVGAGVHGNSHLRNALLQGMSTQSAVGNGNNNNNSNNNISNIGVNNNATNATIGSSSNVDSDVGVTTTTQSTTFTNNACNNNVGVNSESTSQHHQQPSQQQQSQLQQQKPSTLSSSHATLTALLNNPANAPSQDKNITSKLRK